MSSSGFRIDKILTFIVIDVAPPTTCLEMPMELQWLKLYRKRNLRLWIWRWKNSWNVKEVTWKVHKLTSRPKRYKINFSKNWSFLNESFFTGWRRDSGEWEQLRVFQRVLCWGSGGDCRWQNWEKVKRQKRHLPEKNIRSFKI